MKLAAPSNAWRAMRDTWHCIGMSENEEDGIRSRAARSMRRASCLFIAALALVVACKPGGNGGGEGNRAPVTNEITNDLPRDASVTDAPGVASAPDASAAQLREAAARPGATGIKPSSSHGSVDFDVNGSGGRPTEDDMFLTDNPMGDARGTGDAGGSGLRGSGRGGGGASQMQPAPR